MYPFEDDSVDACVRLEPQDIGRMPIDCWSYGSNSFLLHGYYSYRHLILARVKPEKEKRGSYILGVPGTQHSREALWRICSVFGSSSRFGRAARGRATSDIGIHSWPDEARPAKHLTYGMPAWHTREKGIWRRIFYAV